MNKNLIIFEDARYENFCSLTHLRPIYFLRPGIRSLCQKMVDGFDGYQPFLFCRPDIEDLTRENTDYQVNAFSGRHSEDTILINGALRPNPEFYEALKKADGNVVVSSSQGDIVAVKVLGLLSDAEFQDLMNGDLEGFIGKVRTKADSMTIEIPFYNYLWDMVSALADEIVDDFAFFRARKDEDFSSPGQNKIKGVSFIQPENILLASDARLLPGCVLDASSGPIFVDRDARIEPYTYLIGPAYIGKGTILVGGRIASCSIGPVCRIGGELEASIIQGYTNKYHAGFIGHSYIGEWVNFGAMTTNSDLKNNYQPVAVSVNGRMVETGLVKVGSFVGDFTKTAIGTLLNTGINIGLSCNIVADGLVAEKEMPSFTWYLPRHKMDYKIVKALDTVERVMSRRNRKLTDALRRRLEEVSRISSVRSDISD
ncbi:MAG: hypothetical protein JSV44_05325 [Candidatus Zixiibacteriota bacterium]|nr:MAG: hypothetical protein JSV44_05325 [candidate division Zixibacteria bacterium]